MNATNGKKFISTKDPIKFKYITKSKATIINKQPHKEKIIDDIQIKNQSPYMYNRQSLPKTESNNKNLELVNKYEEINMEKQILNIRDNRVESSDQSQRKNIELEKEIMKLKNKIKEQDKIIETQKETINQLQDQNTELKLDNERVREKYNVLKQKVRQRMVEDEGIIIPIDNIMHAQTVSHMIENMRQALNSRRYEQEIINQLYPDPDNMTYEQLLELQEKIGFVNKGLSPDEIQKIQLMKYSKHDKHKMNFIETCLICQSEFIHGENLKILNCQHYYHIDCVDEWLKSNKNCPICKEDVKI